MMRTAGSAGCRGLRLAGIGLILCGAAPAAGTFRSAVDAAWQRSPDRLSLEGQHAAAQARGQAARTLFPDAPSVTGTYADDHLIGSNEGFTTYQAEISTPVWLPGEGTATERVAHADAASAEAQSETAHLAVAVHVLEAAANALLAREEVSVARRRLSLARSLSEQIGRMAGAGESPHTDAASAHAEAASAAIAALDARARELSALAVLSDLTGSAEIPQLSSSAAPITRTAARGNADHDEVGIIEHDPRVVMAQRKVEAAQAALELTRIADRSDPELGLEGIRDKQFGSPWDTRVGVVLHIPLPSRARNLPRIANAQSSLTTAEAELLRARRAVALGVSQVRANFEAARLARVQAEHAAHDLDGRAVQIERAWRVGEIPLIEVVRARQSAFDAERTLARADVMVQAETLRGSLAAGTIP